MYRRRGSRKKCLRLARLCFSLVGWLTTLNHLSPVRADSRTMALALSVSPTPTIWTLVPSLSSSCTTKTLGRFCSPWRCLWKAPHGLRQRVPLQSSLFNSLAFARIPLNLSPLIFLVKALLRSPVSSCTAFLSSLHLDYYRAIFFSLQLVGFTSASPLHPPTSRFCYRQLRPWHS